MWSERAAAGRERLARLKSFGPYARALLVSTARGTFAVDAEDGAVGQIMLQHGGFQDHEVQLATSHFSLQDDVLIVGAHIGAHVVALSRYCHELVAIEANPNTFELLKLNVAMNRCENVVVHNTAAGSDGEKISFVLNRENSGGSKRAPVIRDLGYFYDDPEEIELETAALDTLLGNRTFRFILMDIEGSEYFALKNMPGILSRAHTLAVEFLTFHIRDVAGITIEEFAAPILPHFDELYIPEEDRCVDKVHIVAELARMYQAGENHDLLYFRKRP